LLRRIKFKHQFTLVYCGGIIKKGLQISIFPCVQVRDAMALPWMQAQVLAFDHATKGRSCVLVGGGGTGKSMILFHIRRFLETSQGKSVVSTSNSNWKQWDVANCGAVVCEAGATFCFTKIPEALKSKQVIIATHHLPDDVRTALSRMGFAIVDFFQKAPSFKNMRKAFFEREQSTEEEADSTTSL